MQKVKPIVATALFGIFIAVTNTTIANDLKPAPPVAPLAPEPPAQPISTVAPVAKIPDAPQVPPLAPMAPSPAKPVTAPRQSAPEVDTHKGGLDTLLI